MYSPATRLLTILELLQSHEQLSGTELARRLEVDKRSIRRYIVSLQDLGIPVEGTSGIHGGYRIRPGFKLPPLMLTEDEAVVVMLGLLGSRHFGMEAPRETVEAAIAKIQRVLPEAVRTRVQALETNLTLESPISSTIDGNRWLLDLTQAAASGYSLRIRYISEQGEESDRIVDPYGVATHMGFWYAVGYCHLRDDFRTFRLDRIQELEQTDQHFDVPREFDCFEYLMWSIATVPGRWRVEVKLYLPLEEARKRIRPGYALLHPTDDGVQLSGHFNDLNAVTRYLVSLGCDFDILQPDELRTAMSRLGRRLIAIAGDSGVAALTP